MHITAQGPRLHCVLYHTVSRRGSYGNWKHYMKRHRVWEIPAHFVRHTQTQAVCVWSKGWARISAGLRWLLDTRRWRRSRNYQCLMSPIATAISTLDCILAPLIPVPYVVLYVCVFFNNIAPIPVSITTHNTHCMLSLPLTGRVVWQEGAFDRGAFYPGAIDRGGKKHGGIWPGGIDRTPECAPLFTAATHSLDGTT